MVRFTSSSMSFICRQGTEKSAESHGTDTVHLFKDCYPLDKNETDVPVETESISTTNQENSEASRQIFQDASSTQDQDILQDQDIVHEQLQEQMKSENEIYICKFYMKKCCKHGLGVTTAIIIVLYARKYIENPENGCRPECTSYHQDKWKYSMKLRKCYNVNCNRIHLKRTMRQRPPEEQHYHTRKQTSLITPTALNTQPLKTNLTKPPVPLTLIILHAPLLIPAPIPIIQFFPILPRSPHPNFQQPSSPRQNINNHPPTLHNTTTRMISQLQKSNRTRMINSFLYSKK